MMITLNVVGRCHWPKHPFSYGLLQSMKFSRQSCKCLLCLFGQKCYFCAAEDFSSSPTLRNWAQFSRPISDWGASFNLKPQVYGDAYLCPSFLMQVTVPPVLLRLHSLPVSVGRAQACGFKEVKQLLWGDTLSPDAMMITGHCFMCIMPWMQPFHLPHVHLSCRK